MAAMDFPPNTAHPAAPAVGDKWPSPPVPNKPVYIWDGVKWTTVDTAIADVVGPSSTLPKMDDRVAATGVEANWSRGDHVHPSDLSKLDVIGGTVSPGPLMLDYTPGGTLDAVNKAYVDASPARFVSISLGGVSSTDITVPATAKIARLTGVLYNAVGATARVQVSMAPGVFITTSSSTYVVNGFGYNSLAAGDVIPRTSVAETGFLMHGPPSADNLAQPAQFDATITLARPDSSRVFNCESRCSYFSGFDNWHWFLTTYLIASAGGTSLNVLALRLLSTSNWSAGSYLSLEWIGQ